MRRMIAAMSLCLAFAGCAGTLNSKRVAYLYPGEPIGQVVAVMGKPGAILSKSDGTAVYTWSRVNLMTGRSAAVSMQVRDGRITEVPPMLD